MCIMGNQDVDKIPVTHFMNRIGMGKLYFVFLSVYYPPELRSMKYYRMGVVHKHLMLLISTLQNELTIALQFIFFKKKNKKDIKL